MTTTPIRILVIDDEPSIRQVVAFALGDEGYDVVDAADGRGALDLIGEAHPDIILLDMKMPGMDGWEFVRIYRERYGHQAPIVILTAAQNAAQRAAEAGVESYVAKPFDLDTLIEHVATLAAPLRTTQE